MKAIFILSLFLLSSIYSAQQDALSRFRSRALLQKSAAKDLVSYAENNQYEELSELLKTQLSQFTKPDLESALYAAVKNGHLLTTQLLQDNGVSIYSSFDGISLLHIAAQYGQLELIRYLLISRLGIDNKDKENAATPLMYAANSTGPAQAEAVRILLDYGADLYGRTDSGNTVLSLAVQSGNTDVVSIIFEITEDKNQKEEAFFEAATNPSDATVLEAILKSGFDPDTVNENGETAMTLAAGLSLVDHLRLLLAYGVDPNEKNLMKQSPLSLACNAKCNSVIVAELIMAGADVNAENSEGSSAYDECSKWLACEDEVKFLTAAGAKTT